MKNETKDVLDNLKKLLDDNPGLEISLPGTYTEAQLVDLGFSPASKQ